MKRYLKNNFDPKIEEVIYMPQTINQDKSQEIHEFKIDGEVYLVKYLITADEFRGKVVGYRQYNGN
jgi:hypothetical protein